MTKYRASVACDPSAYGHIEVEADNVEAAVAQITRERIEGVVSEVEYLGATSHRIVEMFEIDEGGDDVDLVAEAVDVPPANPDAAPQVVVVIEEGLVSAVYYHGLPEIDVVVLDTDTEGSSEEDGVVTVTLEGEDFETFVGGPTPEKLGARFVAPTEFHPEAPIIPGEFEKAIMAGYKVEHIDPVSGRPWTVITPGDEEIAYLETERAGWEAADNHRLFGDIRGA